jgi:tricorn protease
MLFAIEGQMGHHHHRTKAEPECHAQHSAIQVKISPKEEWPNIFNEAWRVNRDYLLRS